MKTSSFVITTEVPEGKPYTVEYQLGKWGSLEPNGRESLAWCFVQITNSHSTKSHSQGT